MNWSGRSLYRPYSVRVEGLISRWGPTICCGDEDDDNSINFIYRGDQRRRGRQLSFEHVIRLMDQILTT
jgi:hypothetical protein